MVELRDFGAKYIGKGNDGDYKQANRVKAQSFGDAIHDFAMHILVLYDCEGNRYTVEPYDDDRCPSKKYEQPFLVSVVANYKDGAKVEQYVMYPIL